MMFHAFLLLVPTVSADPAALHDLSGGGRDLDDELHRGARRLLGHHADLGAAVASLGATFSSLDRWVGDVGAAFAAADGATSGVVTLDERRLAVAPYGIERPAGASGFAALVGWSGADDPWIDAAFPDLAARRLRDPKARANPDEVARFVGLLSESEVWLMARQVANALEGALDHLGPTNRSYLLAALWAVRTRLDARWPRAAFVDPDRCRTSTAPPDLARVRRVLEVRSPTRDADLLTGLADGFVLGDFDDKGYTNGWGEFGRIAGQFASGLIPVAGDARDATANGLHRRWGAMALNAAFAVPGFGDAGRLIKDGDRTLELLGRLDDLAEPHTAARLFREASEGAEAWKHLDGPLWSAGAETPARNVVEHFVRHADEFEGLDTPLDYASAAHRFLHDPPAGTLSLVRENGDIVRYHPDSESFGILTRDGAPRTFFKPDPAAHGYHSNLEYFHDQG